MAYEYADFLFDLQYYLSCLKAGELGVGEDLPREFFEWLTREAALGLLTDSCNAVGYY